jgi:hypothetical protein
MTADTMIAPRAVGSTHTPRDRHRMARLAGLVYLALVVQGVFALIYVPNALTVSGDSAATAARILAAQPLFVASLVNALVLLVTFPLLAFLLYRLLEGVNRTYAAVMLILVLVQVPPAIVELQRQLSALDLLRGGGFLSALGQPEREAIAMLFLDPTASTIAPLELFWGLWLLPLGALVYRSGFLPRFLGAWLVVNGVAYALLSVIRIVAPLQADMATTLATPALLAELALMLWLLIRGAPGRAVGTLP